MTRVKGKVLLGEGVDAITGLIDISESHFRESRNLDQDHSLEMERCRRDVVYWINQHVKTYDPRTSEKVLPFLLFPRQVEFLLWLQERKRLQQSGLCDKSRGVGVSFLCCADALHDWLFVPGYKAGFGSHKLDYVDKLGDLSSLLEKIRFMLRHLPQWMHPAGFKWRLHDCHTKIINPDTGAAITGEGGDEVGRGGRTSIYYVDEAARLEHPARVDQALIETTNVRIDISTPNGPGNPFAVTRFSLPPERVFSFHWTSDIRKNHYEVRDAQDDLVAQGNGIPDPSSVPPGARVVYPWREEKVREKGATAFAAEYDIDYSASIEGITIPGAWVRAAVCLHLDIDTSSPTSKTTSSTRWAGLDIGEEGSNLSVLMPRRGPCVGVPIHWQGALTTQTAWRARDEAVRLGITDIYYDADGVGTGVKSTWKTATLPLPFTDHPVHTGTSPTLSRWPDGETSQQKFLNLKAELWWCLRRRFEKVYEHVTQGVVHPPPGR